MRRGWLGGGQWLVPPIVRSVRIARAFPGYWRASCQGRNLLTALSRPRLVCTVEPLELDRFESLKGAKGGGKRAGEGKSSREAGGWRDRGLVIVFSFCSVSCESEGGHRLSPRCGRTNGRSCAACNVPGSTVSSRPSVKFLYEPRGVAQSMQTIKTGFPAQLARAFAECANKAPLITDMLMCATNMRNEQSSIYASPYAISVRIMLYLRITDPTSRRSTPLADHSTAHRLCLTRCSTFLLPP